MSFVAMHFASGLAFFSGSAILVVGILVATFARRKVLAASGRLLILAGLVLIVLSATPLPVWAWCVWGTALLIWVVARLTKGSGTFHAPSAAVAAPSEEAASKLPVVRHQGNGTRSVPAAMAVVACTLAAVGWELSWQVAPGGLQATHRQVRKPDLPRSLVVIGDSLSAEDFTEGGDPWPMLLAREHGIEVQNLAFSGAKAGSAAKRVTAEGLGGDIVLLEIGGNDLLGGTDRKG